jgi:hypothetical protein
MAPLLLRARTYVAWLALLIAVYLATWPIDPYVYGFAVLGLAWASGAAVLCALVGAFRSPPARVRLVVVAALIVAANVAAFAALKTIRWA